jgi:endonuclease YncB( thermonuclease family)
VIRIATAVFAALMFASMPNAFADDLAGQASVIDGDTLEIHGTRIRLWGIDAPESNQPAVAMTAFSIDAGPRPRMTWTRS